MSRRDVLARRARTPNRTGTVPMWRDCTLMCRLHGEPPMMRIVLADDQAMVRTGLRLILEQQRDMSVVGEAGNGFEAVAVALRLQPDVLVLDVDMPEMDGLDALEHVKRRVPQIRVVMLADAKNDRYLQHALRWGALGYVLKQSPAERLVRTVQQVVQGHLAVEWLGDVNLADAFRPGGRRGLSMPSYSELTEREREVLRLVAQGYSNAGIAARLGIGAKTVDTHRSHVMEKLDIHTRADLTRYALQRGYVIVEPPRRARTRHAQHSGRAFRGA